MKELVAKNTTNSVYYILRFLKLIVLIRTTNSKIAHEELDKLLEVLATNSIDWSVFSSFKNEDYRKALFYFIDYGAATSLTIQHRLGLSVDKTHRLIKDMINKNLIKKAIKIPSQINSRGGPRPTLYKVVDANSSQINEALTLHRRLTSPKYRYAEEMAQLMIDEYVSDRNVEEVSEHEYIAFLREKNIKSPLIPDLVLLSAPFFNEKGIKFWTGRGKKFRA